MYDCSFEYKCVNDLSVSLSASLSASANVNEV